MISLILSALCLPHAGLRLSHLIVCGDVGGVCRWWSGWGWYVVWWTMLAWWWLCKVELSVCCLEIVMGRLKANTED